MQHKIFSYFGIAYLFASMCFLSGKLVSVFVKTITENQYWIYGFVVVMAYVVIIAVLESIFSKKEIRNPNKQ